MLQTWPILLVSALLADLGRIDPVQSDAPAGDLEAVTVDDARPASDHLVRERRATDQDGR